jgi:CelD/BcsL family acetyltransferase involved in cellulose biosynthesis
MSVYEVNPLHDPRWLALLEQHPRASIFHHSSWIEALRRTYGYVPVVLTTSPSHQPLSNGVLFCHVNSWLTGHRMVSVPFSDHCEPLARPSELEEIFTFVQSEIARKRLRYVEVRPVSPVNTDAVRESEKFAFHVIDLRRDQAEIFQSLHKDSIRRKIQRAQREQLAYEQGTASELLKKFYQLYVLTRRRHGLPPSPFRWFANLADCLGDRAQVRVASKDNQPVAAIVTLKFGKTMVYKYGASDSRFNNLGGTPFLFWKAIEEAKAEDLHALDLGRSDLNNDGLIRFKDHLGSTRTSLSYWKLPMSAQPTRSSHRFELARRFLLHAPRSIQIGVGSLFAKHMG